MARRDPANNPLAIKIGEKWVVYAIDELVWGPFVVVLGGGLYLLYRVLPSSLQAVMYRIVLGWREGAPPPIWGNTEHLLLLAGGIVLLYFLYILGLMRFA